MDPHRNWQWGDEPTAMVSARGEGNEQPRKTTQLCIQNPQETSRMIRQKIDQSQEQPHKQITRVTVKHTFESFKL